MSHPPLLLQCDLILSLNKLLLDTSLRHRDKEVLQYFIFSVSREEYYTIYALFLIFKNFEYIHFLSFI